MALSFESRRRRRRIVAAAAFCLSALMLAWSIMAFSTVAFDEGASAQPVRPPSNAVENATPPARGGAGSGDVGVSIGSGGLGGDVPSGVEGATNADVWRAVRAGVRGTVSIPNQSAGVLVQSGGEAWRSTKPIVERYGLYGLGGVLVLLLLFYLVRGRIRIDAGASGQTITRFKALERFGHWLLAGSFIVLALTGLMFAFGWDVWHGVQNLVGDPRLEAWETETGEPYYGFGAATFAGVMEGSKWLHNNVSWAFMIGLALVFLMWVGHNIPGRLDLKWLAKGGGLFSKGVHVDSRKFNAGQKLIFWSTILLGLSVSLSGVALLFPQQTHMMSGTFGIMNAIGFDLPTDLDPRGEEQLQTLWHAIVAFAMMVIIIAHIYIGSLGMEGAFDAMGTGEVDLNWAKEHHNLWVEEVQARERGAGAETSHGAATPAE